CSSRRRHTRCRVVSFFKQKTAYAIAQCLVGSEMCIRDRLLTLRRPLPKSVGGSGLPGLSLIHI
ncbi:hypothetical protein, partial [Staphylococcus aureus]